MLSEITERPEASLSASSSLESDLQMESIDIVEFQLALEEQFDVALDPMELIELNELDSIVSYVARQLAISHATVRT